ncbi:catechol 2,3-dioxygenase-like lactoylglutathione lyase family enzyme [Microbacterium phyllosphaerae]|uniref:Catechol 2,3-dioxygenase-like lactoylglutathione lyase family enzyme n=1 Tax=Microbacterium phyllosphaerae TaxID=124798 RepID=A0ABS4WNB3_9MICO|nr:VOC family protein [Microbacterium phyllosphaerae]MBP2377695.1 catechol 2,3-dioxygenase-like lactoylglutathione lyase family enzyme [Microbacterium phyllosphaerae]MCS3442384.1 catechol 2,3-dioxygenase-like lactoylglutathione lyase family enzyme [Microbacterium phyllosphaerae]
MTAFQTTHAFSGFSVDDIDAARSFYGDTLGFDVTTNAMGFLDIHLPDGGSILVYAKPNHTPASFTILNFPVDDIDAAVDELNGRGVVTKIYDDSEFATDEKGILRGGPDRGPDIAWFTDPAGNVLAVMSAA